MGSRTTIDHLDVSRRGISDLLPWVGDQSLSLITQLDASRNSLRSTTGIEYLVELRTLSLYYNKIDDLHELRKLRRCRSLQSLDLRLNPVTRVEGYRGCVRAL
jgi:Leucine-rich repeat (LRR) protein